MLEIPWSYVCEEWKCLDVVLDSCYVLMFFKSLLDEIYLCVDVTSVFVLCTWTHSINDFKNALVALVRRMQMSEFVLTPAMFWNVFKSWLDEIDLCVDVLCLFFKHVDKIITILEIPWSYFVEEWTCLICSWLLYVLKDV